VQGIRRAGDEGLKDSGFSCAKSGNSNRCCGREMDVGVSATRLQFCTSSANSLTGFSEFFGVRFVDAQISKHFASIVIRNCTVFHLPLQPAAVSAFPTS
jgi:hypothetical protein